MAILLALAAFAGCVQNNTTDKNNSDGKGDNHVPLKGDVESVWFDDLFAAYYPAQLDGKVEVIFSKAYFYGDVQTKQPVMCLCSKIINDISLFALEDGVKGEELYKVETLAPMEVIWIFPELSENPNIGISFADEQGNTYSYALSKNEAGNEVVMTPFES